MASTARTVKNLTRRIKKLEADMKLANARIRALETHPSYAITWPAWSVERAPTAIPYTGDVPNVNISGTITINSQPVEPFKGQQ